MIGRQVESKILMDAANADRSRFIVVYGRRRVGKTYLIRETFNYSFAFSHTGIEGAPMSEQLDAFRESLAEQGLLDVDRPKDWIEAFSLLKRLLKSSPDGRKVIFIDELPWMDTPRARFVRALENFWNGWCAARKDIVLIVCGSATSWMIRTVLRNKGGLFNRANRVLYLEPFTLRQCEEYMRDSGFAMSRYEIAEGYMVFGGSPYYWSLLDKSLSMAQNIDRLCFTAAGELAGEFRRLYASVFKHPEKHLRVITVLYDRREGLTREEISQKAKMPATGKLTLVLEELEESGFLRRFAPSGRKKRGTVYQLMDNFTIFHLQFMAGMSSVRNGFWLSNVDTALRNAWEGIAFERVCMWHQDAIKAALGISGVSVEISSWRSAAKTNGAQIDMLIDRADGVVNVCEMKFTRGEFSIGDAYAKRLRDRVQLFKDETGTRKSVHLTFVTTYGVKRNANAGMVQSEVTLDDLFREV
ncbi:MAG: ATP-binding protein [Kiritimatiellae bacterium]|nr:ATP-binding protein [Kiritimatiellia bacterium]